MSFALTNQHPCSHFSVIHSFILYTCINISLFSMSVHRFVDTEIHDICMHACMCVIYIYISVSTCTDIFALVGTLKLS